MPDFAAIGGGIHDELKALVAQRLYEQMQAARIADMEQGRVAEQQRIGLAGRELDQRSDQFGKRLNLDTREQGFKEQVHADEAPERKGRLDFITAQTTDLKRRPEREQTDRDFNMAKMGMEHTYRSQEIDQSGRNQRAVAEIQGRNRGILTPSQRITAERGLMKDFRAATGPAREMERQLTIMDEGLKAARAGNLNAGSQAVLVTFQKILDPQSVVRESEYARSPEGLSVMQRIQGIPQRLMQGGPGVPVAELEQFANLARQITQAMKQEADMKTADYRAIAEANGLNLNFGAGETPQTQTTAPPNAKDPLGIR